MNIDKKIVDYIEKKIFPKYELNDRGHNIEHINHVIERSLNIASKLKDINLNIVYVIAAYHDIGYMIDKDKHEIVSSEIFYNDGFITKFFSDNENIVIKEAIRDHRSSNREEPRSIYGKIIRTADKIPNVDETILKTHFYSKKYFSYMNFNDMIDRAYNELNKRYGRNGESKVYFEDEEYIKFKKECILLLDNKNKFAERYIRICKNYF